ncbi:MAG TPA: polyphenol oxidase family protein [Actinomycetales bacterium]|nr:polyphenol oxidase family protein [Actinomycetales bacterium]
MLWWAEQAGPREALRAFTGRQGGVSSGDFAGLNLGDHVGDDPAAVAENRSRLATEVGVAPGRLLFARQVHGTGVAVVDGPWQHGPPEADAMVTATPGLALGVLVADCVPVLLHAPEEGVVGVAHAGRRGMADGVLDAVVGVMRELGATTLLATVGPSVCARCYEVPATMRADVSRRRPVTASVSWHGTPSLDVAAGVLEQLAPHCWDLEQVRGCTVERDDLYSHRGDGTTGRWAGVAVLRDVP